MNSFGNKFRISIFGESHGNGVGITLDGVPPGIAIKVSDFETDLKRRQGGNLKGTTPRQETDIPRLLSGVFNDFTTGAPLTIFFENNNTQSKDYSKHRAIPRPGHADFVAHKKFKGFEDYRGGGHFSGRLTACVVAAGVIAKKIIGNIECQAVVEEVAGNKNINEAIEKAIADNDSVGGIIYGEIKNVPLGLGEPFWDSIESRLAHAFFSIPAVKGVSFGSGFQAPLMKGSEHNDALLDDTGKTATNYAGGIVGGISNGNTITYRLAIKPTSSTPKEQKSLNVESGELENFVIEGRHDLCIALRVPPVAEAMAAIVIADFLLAN